MVVAVGVSATFILLLTGLLAETLRVSVNLQDQLYAVAIAEVVTESARKTPYSVLNSYAGTAKKELKIYMDNDPVSVPRVPPIQFDLSSTESIFGAVDSQLGQVELSKRWTTEKGNFFRGRVEQTVSNIKDKAGLDAVQVDVDVFYSVGGKESKRITRSVVVFNHE